MLREQWFVRLASRLACVSSFARVDMCSSSCVGSARVIANLGLVAFAAFRSFFGMGDGPPPLVEGDALNSHWHRAFAA